jgi:hypothetical protein
MGLAMAAVAVLAATGPTPECSRPPTGAPFAVETPTGVARVELEPPEPPGCWNAAVITWTDESGSREILRWGGESMTTAEPVRWAGQNLIFLRGAQPSASADWSFSQLLWIRPRGELVEVDIHPHASCDGYPLPHLGEPIAHGGYRVRAGAIGFRATFEPNRPGMAYVEAELELQETERGYALAVAACAVSHPGP